MKIIAPIFLMLFLSFSAYGYEKTEVIKINYKDGKFIVERNAITIDKGYSCIVLNTKTGIGYWLIPPKSWSERSCLGFAGKTQSQLYKLHKNDGTTPVIRNSCIKIENLKCGYKNLTSKST